MDKVLLAKFQFHDCFRLNKHPHFQSYHEYDRYNNLYPLEQQRNDYCDENDKIEAQSHHVRHQNFQCPYLPRSKLCPFQKYVFERHRLCQSWDPSLATFFHWHRHLTYIFALTRQRRECDPDVHV